MVVIAEEGRLDASVLEVGDIFVKAYRASYGLMRHSGEWTALREYRVDRILKRDIVSLSTRPPDMEPMELIRLNRNGVALDCFAPNDPALVPIRTAIRRQRALSLIKGVRLGDIDDELMQAIFAWRKRRNPEPDDGSPGPR